MKSLAARAVNNARKLLPKSSVPLIVAVRTAIARRRSSVWAEAMNQMRFVVGEQEQDAVIEPLAAAYIKRSIWRGESRWHPSLVNRQRIEGIERVHKLRKSHPSVILCFVHLGDYEGIAPSFCFEGIPVHEVVVSVAFTPDAPIWMQQSAKVVMSHPDVTAIDVARGSQGVKEALGKGVAVAIAIDQPGHTKVDFLGHELMLSSGAARIAKDTGTPVVVVTAHPDPTHPDAHGMFKVAAILDPADFESAEAMLDVMLRHHEAAFRAWPEAAEHPLRMTDMSLVKQPSNPPPSAATQEPDEPTGGAS